MESLGTFNYNEPLEMFVKFSLKAVYQNLLRIIVLICEKSRQYDSITQQMDERIQKCEKEYETFVKI